MPVRPERHLNLGVTQPMLDEDRRLADGDQVAGVCVTEIVQSGRPETGLVDRRRK